MTNGEVSGSVAVPQVAQIHLAKASRMAMEPHDSVECEAGVGLVGDRYHGTRHRHVTVQSMEALAEASDVFGQQIDPAATRRNLTISSGVVPSTPGDRIRIGAVELEAVRIAAPCKLLDDVIGRGAKVALRRRAGTVFRALTSGTITIDDAVDLHLEPSVD